MSEPRRLIEGLNALDSSVRVPGEVDRAILSMGRARMMGIRARNRWRVAVKWGIGVAAAAMVAVAVRVGTSDRPTENARRELRSMASMPKQDSRQTMLDAYLLARRVKLGEKLSQEWDLNHDGAVNEQDAKVIAAAAVKLEGGPVQ